MVGLLRLAGLGLSLAACAIAFADEPPRSKFRAGIDLSYVDASGHASFIEGGAGKLRFDDGSDGLLVSRAYVDYRLRTVDTIDAVVVAEAYDDALGSTLDFSEAYVEWRPLTLTRNRYRFRAGAFYPQLSLENGGPAWSSLYTISSSAINTWIAEEIRMFGVEAAVSRRPVSLGGAHTFSFRVAAFWNNDPAGALLAWKGWSLHDRQSRFGDTLPLPSLPQLTPDGAFWRQDPFLLPFMEIDDRAGYYASAEWQYSRRLKLRAAHYDNRADPMGLEDRQYGWATRFDHLGFQAALPADLGLIAQWLEGSTAMGPWLFGAHASDVTFRSYFLLLTRAFGEQRLSLRFDRFRTTDVDRIPLDENSESGRAWTLAWLVELRDGIAVAAEWLDVRSERPAWDYNALDTDRRERQLQLSLRLRFGGQ